MIGQAQMDARWGAHRARGHPSRRIACAMLLRMRWRAHVLTSSRSARC